MLHKTLHPEKLHSFWESGKFLNFKRKEIIYMVTDEIAPTFYWIRSGYIKVCSYSKTGNERIHFIYGPNDLFPVGWLLTGSTQWVSFVALDDVELVAKGIDSFNEFVAQEPLLFSEITRMQLNAHDRIYGMNLDSPSERIAHCLLMLANRFGKAIDQFIMIEVPLSQQEFADMVKMSRETAGKVLNDFESKDYLIYGRKRIMINKPELSKVLAD